MGDGLRIYSGVCSFGVCRREGAIKLANGELTHRVSAIRTEDLSDLAAAFNAMGEQIEQNQAALSELATRDGLTDLLNRREFLRLLQDEIGRARRYGRSFAVLLLDIDHFKKVNGGEEFAILLTETGLAAATTAAERFRAEVAKVLVVPDNRSISVTASIGIAAAALAIRAPALATVPVARDSVIWSCSCVIIQQCI